jgi:hypothetical protein
MDARCRISRGFAVPRRERRLLRVRLMIPIDPEAPPGTLRSRLLHAAVWLSLVAGCGGEDPALDDVSQEVGTPLSNLVTNVGVAKGMLAVQFNGAWFSVGSDPLTGWSVANDVDATAVAAPPVDTSVQTEACECVPAERGACTRQEQIEQCGPTIEYIIDQTRTFNLTVGASQYQVRALQTIRRERAIAGGLALNLGFQADMRFEISVHTPGDPSLGDSTWVVSARPKRHFIDCQFDDETLEAINIAAEPTSSSTTPACNGTYSTEVQFTHARTDALAGAGEMKSPVNDALDEALRQTFPNGLPYIHELEPEAYDVRGSVNARTADETLGEISDLGRSSKFYLKAREVADYSEPADERNLITSTVPRVPDGLSTSYTNTKTWGFKPILREKRVRWPLLAGICGVEAFARFSASGGVTASQQVCFDGYVQTLSVRGRLAFDASAGAGGYCNIILASASAGLQAGVGTAVEFESVLETVPPAIRASVNAYAELRFAAYSQVRILFWSKRWEKTIAARRLWQRGFTHRVLETVSAPELCNPPAIDLRDMVLVNSPVYYPAGQQVPFPPPIPNGTTAQLTVLVPSYPNATTDLKIKSTGAPALIVPTLSSPPGLPITTVTATFPSSAMGLNGTLHRVRFEREETVQGLRVRHVSNWIDVPRVGP